MLVASVLAGGLWDAYGPTATFLAGAGFTAVALIGLMFSEAGPSKKWRRMDHGGGRPGDLTRLDPHRLCAQAPYAARNRTEMGREH